MQVWPVPQPGLLPHMQSPAAEQLSALLESQATQVSPLRPQRLIDAVRQRPASQQPFGHEAASQTTQIPPMQLSVAAQIGAPPHWQSPLTEQLSAL